MNNSEIKHIIWDWNGTLLDDFHYCVDTINIVLKEENLPELDKEKYREIFTFPVKTYYERLNFNFKKSPFERVGGRFIELYEKNRAKLEIFSDTKEVLKSINFKNIKQSVLSAYSETELKSIISNFSLTSNFSHIMGLDNVYANGKMGQAGKLLNLIDLNPKEILLIGDSIHDYNIAKEFNLNCFLLSHGHISKKRLGKCNVPILENLSEILLHI